MRIIGILGVVSVIVIAIASFFVTKQIDAPIPFPTSFDDCVALGNPVMESYPRQCRDGEGTLFIENIKTEVVSSDRIRVAMPQPNAVIESPLTIKGEAQGTWFFEGDAGVELWVGEDRIALGYIAADGEWMTGDLVPFTGTLEFDFIHTKDVAGQLVFTESDPRNPEDRGRPLEKLTIPVIVVPTQIKYTEGKKCVVGGCSNQLCTDDKDIVTTCEWRKEYACYETAICEMQSDGECGWTETNELTQCIEESRN